VENPVEQHKMVLRRLHRLLKDRPMTGAGNSLKTVAEGPADMDDDSDDDSDDNVSASFDLDDLEKTMTSGLNRGGVNLAGADTAGAIVRAELGQSTSSGSMRSSSSGAAAAAAAVKGGVAKSQSVGSAAAANAKHGRFGGNKSKSSNNSKQEAPMVEEPENVDSIVMSAGMATLAELLAQNIHEAWCADRLTDGWRYAPEKMDITGEIKCTPKLQPFAQLPYKTKKKLRQRCRATLKTLMAWGFRVDPPAVQTREYELMLDKVRWRWRVEEKEEEE
jgi:hypothetical protein